MAHILIVDDSPTEIHVLRTMLEKHGFQTSAVTSGEEGVTKAKAERPDLILMDVVMPGVSGFQATRQLNRDPATGAIPIIIVTTKDQETDRLWGLRQGARDYIVKPVIEEDLVAKIQAVLGE